MKRYKTGIAFMEDGIHPIEWNLEKIREVGFESVFYGWDHSNIRRQVKAAGEAVPPGTVTFSGTHRTFRSAGRFSD